MKRLLLSLVLITFPVIDEARACSVVILGLRHEYRSSKQIFVGEVVSVESGENRHLPEKVAKKWRSLEHATFRIDKSWKGQDSGSISLYLNPVCDCPDRNLYSILDRKLLVFADKDGVVDACDLYVMEMQGERQKERREEVTKKLDSFWFRTWAAVYPF